VFRIFFIVDFITSFRYTAYIKTKILISMVNLRKLRMRLFESKSLKEKMAVKVDFYSRLLNDLQTDLNLTDSEFHNLCEVFADKCSLNIFQGGKIDNLELYATLIKSSYPSKVIEESKNLSISITRVKKQSVFPFNIPELFINEAEFRVEILRLKPKMVLTNEVLTVFYDYWPPCEKQQYFDDEDLEMYWLWIYSLKLMEELDIAPSFFI